MFKEETGSIWSRFTLWSAIASRSIFSQTWVATLRYHQLLWGSCTTFCTTLAFNVVNAVLNTSAYYISPRTATGPFQKSGALFFSLVYFFLDALTEVAATVDTRSILLKQFKYGFIHPVSYVFASTIADIPVAAAQCIVFSCLLFHAGPCFGCFRLLDFHTVCIRALWSCAGHVPGVPVALLYSGYAPTISSMHRWGSWIRRISLSPWAFEALMASEFAKIDLFCTDDQMVPSGPGYNGMDYQGCTISGSQKGSNTVPGTTYLGQVYQYFPSHIWRNFGIILVLWFLYNMLAALGLAIMTRESRGSYALFYKSRQTPEFSPISGEMEKERTDQDSAASSATGDVSDNLAQQKPRASIDLLHFQRSQLLGQCGWQKQLLTHVSGYVCPSQLTALMGASGAGKTTLLIHSRGGSPRAAWRASFG
ncbi:CDR ABC transporter-domain-containing protein [Aspergillus californicus]